MNIFWFLLGDGPLFGWRWVVMYTFWLVVGGGGWWWLVVNGGGWLWVVVDGGEWWYSLV